MKCPICSEKMNDMCGTYYFDPPANVPGGMIIVPDSTWLQCPQCGEEMLTAKLSKQLEDVAFNRQGQKMSEIKIYRTVIQYEILSPTPLDDYLDLEAINDACINGDCSGKFLESPVSNEEINGDAANELLESHGTDPNFFGVNDDEDDFVDFSDI